MDAQGLSVNIMYGTIIPVSPQAPAPLVPSGPTPLKIVLLVPKQTPQPANYVRTISTAPSRESAQPASTPMDHFARLATAANALPVTTVLFSQVMHRLATTTVALYPTAKRAQLIAQISAKPASLPLLHFQEPVSAISPTVPSVLPEHAFLASLDTVSMPPKLAAS